MALDIQKEEGKCIVVKKEESSLGDIPKGHEVIFCTPMNITDLITAAKMWNQPKSLLTDEW